MLTTAEMRQFENHVAKQQQVAKIKRIMAIKEHATTCETCNLVFVPFYTKQGYDLCPCCDEQTIENYKTRSVKLRNVA